MSPLQVAIWAINVKEVRKMLSESEDPHALASENMEDFENSPLYSAILKYNLCKGNPQYDGENKAKLLEIMALLLEHTTFPENIIQAIAGAIFDHAAPALIDFFVARGADVNGAPNTNHPALCDAIQQRKPKTVQALLKHGATFNNAYFELADKFSFMEYERANCIDILNQLKRHGMPVDGRNGEQQETPLMYAVRAKELTVAKWLLENGADPNAKDRTGKTPLMHLAYNDFHQSSIINPLFTLLIDHHANTKALDAEGNSVLDYALREKNTVLRDELNKYHAAQQGTSAVVSLSSTLGGMNINSAPKSSALSINSSRK